MVGWAGVWNKEEHYFEGQTTYSLQILLHRTIPSLLFTFTVLN